jgi:hypothetical protein
MKLLDAEHYAEKARVYRDMILRREIELNKALEQNNKLRNRLHDLVRIWRTTAACYYDPNGSNTVGMGMDFCANDIERLLKEMDLGHEL